MEQLIYLIRHGETEWSKTGRHTGNSDIPLTELGRDQAMYLEPVFASVSFTHILSSPRCRALDTAKLAGLGGHVEVWDDLVEWDYGDYEGLTTPQIREKVPAWTVWTHPCPGGESEETVTARADRVVERCLATEGNIALFSHGHFLRVLAARWAEQPTILGQHLLLGTSTLSILGWDRGVRAIKTWNGPLLTAACAVPWQHPHGP